MFSFSSQGEVGKIPICFWLLHVQLIIKRGENSQYEFFNEFNYLLLLLLLFLE